MKTQKTQKVYYNSNLDEFTPDYKLSGCLNSLSLGESFRIRCGKCHPCKKIRRMEWSLRLKDEFDSAIAATFITLTYNPESLPNIYHKLELQPDNKKNWMPYQSKYPTVNKKHLVDYIKRIRKHFNKVNTISDAKFRYYACAEYGTKTRRPHYHIILYNFPKEHHHELQNKWQFGHIQLGEVNAKSINYITKYVFKDFYHKTDTRQPPYSTMSKKPIIGHSYLEKNGVFHIENSIIYKYIDGQKRRLPKAYLNRLFTNKEDKIQLIKEYYDKRKNIDKEKINYIALINKHEGHTFLEKVHNYAQSQYNDFERYKKTINEKETL